MNAFIIQQNNLVLGVLSENMTAQGQVSEHHSKGLWEGAAWGHSAWGVRRKRKQKEPGQTGRKFELLVASLFFMRQHCILAEQGN